MDDQKSKQENKAKKIAVIRIRGVNRTSTKIKDTLNMLRIYKKNYCAVLEPTPSNKGMIMKAKDYITWGEIDDETFALLKEKREEKTKDAEGKEIPKKFFRLHPPRGGFERKGIKFQFKTGGVLGYRADKINKLIKKML